MAANSLNSELVALGSTRGALASADPATRDQMVAAFARKLVHKYLRSEGSGAEHDDASALSVVRQIAQRMPGAFGYGDPVATGPVVLALVEWLPASTEEAEERQVLEVALHSRKRCLMQRQT